MGNENYVEFTVRLPIELDDIRQLDKMDEPEKRATVARMMDGMEHTIDEHMYGIKVHSEQICFADIPMYSVLYVKDSPRPRIFIKQGSESTISIDVNTQTINGMLNTNRNNLFASKTVYPPEELNQLPENVQQIVNYVYPLLNPDVLLR